MKKICGICGSPSLEITTETFSLEEILQRWEREANVKFTNAVWQQYTQPVSPQVTLYRCSECGFKVFDPPCAGSSDFYACITTSDGSCYEADKWEFRQAIKDLRRNRCRRVLDIGCGSGYFLDLLRNRLPDVEAVGFEFNSEMANLVRSKGHNIVNGESAEVLLNSPEAAEPFDAICIFQLLEHVTNPVELFTISKRLLKPDGLLIVAVPDNAGPVQYFSTALTELPPHHLSRWRASTFRAGLPRLGFDIKRIAYEPLPAFLWRDYIPVILDHSGLAGFVVEGLKKNDRLVRILNRLRLKWLYGVRGHSVYVVAKKKPE
jgi:SAM-dependent methyltransferase